MEYYDDIFSLISRILSMLTALVNTVVIITMFVKCSRFRRTKVYQHYDGIKTLSKMLEIIVIFLVIEAIYGICRIFPLIDAIKVIESYIPDFPKFIFGYIMFVTVALPIINSVISILAWSYYHGTRRLFFSLYPNGVQPIDFAGRQTMPDDSIFGSSSVANLNYGSEKPAVDTAPMYGQNQPVQNPSQAPQGFYAKASAINNEKNPARQANTNYPQNNNLPNPQKADSKNDDFFGTGISDDYINRLTDADEAKLETLLVRDTPETEYKVTPAKNDNTEGDIFGTGSNLWEAVPDMTDPMLKEILVTEEPEAAAENPQPSDNGQESFFGTGTTEDYMKKFTTADDDIIAELLVQDEPEQK